MPFFAKGISFADVVRATNDGERWVMTGVAFHRGHSTYRFFASLGQKHPAIQALIGELNKVGATVEAADEKLVAIDVPPEADIHKLYSLLQSAAESKLLDFQEGHCGHKL